ncbi:MAG: 30S ribosomal protein S3 [Candidatus Omnitrophica bacterium]|nr:30S ribosomal protein S3 [Candidatus Omnitrophota bacterium]
MGQKVHPLVLRVGYIKDWSSKWTASKKDFAKNIIEDLKIRKFIKKKYLQAAIAKIIIERYTDRVTIKIRTARPGMVIGRHGVDIEKLRQDLSDLAKREINIEIEEITEPFKESQLVAENIAFQIEKRVAFRRAMKRAIEQSMNAGALGIKIICKGRLGGAEMSRQESYRRGKVPLQTLRADIDYGFTEAVTTYGLIGVKVWIYRGDIIPEKKTKIAQEQPETTIIKEEVKNGDDAQKSKVS